MNKLQSTNRLTIRLSKQQKMFGHDFDYDKCRQAIDTCVRNIMASKASGSTTVALNIFRDNYASKWIGELSNDSSLSDAALKKFIECDDHCQSINKTLLTGDIPSWARDCISQASWIVHDILGHTFPFAEWAEACIQSGGAALEVPRRFSSVQTKYGLGSPSITRDALPYYRAVTRGTLLQRERLHIVEGSRFTTVPKNNKTDRPINIEPSGNMFLQKGLGNVLRGRLRDHRAGGNAFTIIKDMGRPSFSIDGLKPYINLNDQKRNQLLAYYASKLDLCTIDLASASDSISCELVRLLLPPEWYAVLMDLRSPGITLPDGTFRTLEKISSMGNGFTFELESIIFYALTKAVAMTESPTAPIGVYGDDIICHILSAKRLVELLQVCGFEINETKSFIGGLFHESCGIFVYDTRVVTPPNLRVYPRSFQDLFRIINKLLRWYYRLFGWYNHNSPWVFPLIQAVPRSWRHRYIPDGVGDGAIIGSHYDARRTAEYHCGIYYQRTLSTKFIKRKADKFGAIIACLKEGGEWSSLSKDGPAEVSLLRFS